LTQQEVVFSRAAKMERQTIEVMVERPAGRVVEDGWVARSQSQAPDIDSVVFVKSNEPLHPGQFINVRVTDYRAYDLIAEVPRKKARALKVLAAT
ncbi:MAG: TRAM domain-containing protein, partial [Phycisphaerae bacterium]|nr:TRAM domain-containing protein [Phycisphaerae bacterium]